MQFVERSSSRFMRFTAVAVALSVGLLLLPTFAQLVSAQTVTIIDDNAKVLSTDSAKVVPSPAATPVVTQEDFQLTQYRDKYKTDLSIYRTDEHDYAIAKEQNKNLQTLASLEAAVKSTRKVMVTRIVVLQDYLQILKLMVSQTSGIDVGEKTTLISELDAQIALAKTHQQRVEQAIDRTLILKSATEFQNLNDSITAVAYKALSYIAYGRLQTVYDKTIAVRDEVKANLEEQEKNGLKLGEKRRALDEINRNLDDTKAKLVKEHGVFTVDSTGQLRKFEASSYGSTIQDLSIIYADLFRNLGLLREVIKT